MARAAVPTASSPEPQSRLIVAPGTSSGRPASKDAMRGIFGVGEKKLEEFGSVFAAVVAGHLETYPRIRFES